MGNRSRTEIVAMILDAANEKGKRNKNYVTLFFLSYNQLKEYLSVLVENNLIEYIDGTKTYKTTQKGLHFLQMHNEIKMLLPQFL